MYWSDKKPTEPGWYWYQPRHKNAFIVEAVWDYSSTEKSRFLVCVYNKSWGQVEWMNGRWSERIPEPIERGGE